MGKRMFRLTGGLIRAFSHRMKTEWEVPFEKGPCVFVVNNVGFMGPVEMITKFAERKRCHPWINDELLEAKKIPAYARKDCWWRPGSFAEPVLNATVPYIAAALIPPLLKNVPYIPVYHDQRIMLTLRQSIRALQKDEAVVIFPEMPNARLSHHEWISTGWMRLGEMWYRSCGRALKMYPVHIDREKHIFRVAAPVWYDPARTFAEQEKELSRALAKGIRG
jgi:hypothetical protein